MMEVKEYIINELGIFIKKFPNIRVRYEYDKNAETHFIEIAPNEVYHLDENYIQWESQIFDKFIEKYPTQNICFISDDALVGIENVETTLYGAEYIPFSVEKESMLFDMKTIAVYQNNGRNITYFTFCNNTENGLGNYNIKGLPPSDNCQISSYLLAA